jgi:6-methylpretetramide 4-monooxygenase / 4-hydroxy-6-methylpretetramide 12a-monooxygenase
MATETDVLVVGAGPSGLFAARELARHGHRPRVVERDPEPHGQARATAIQPGTLEILSRAGLVDRVMAASQHLHFARLFDAQLELIGEIPFGGCGSRWGHQCSLPQWRTEEILTEALGELGVSVQRGVTVESVHARDDAVVAELRHGDGSLETVEARYLIGAGGAHSITRTSLDEELAGSTYPGTALAADVAVDCVLPRDNGALIATPAGYVLLAALPSERWITFIGDLREDERERLEHDRSRESVATAMRDRISGDFELTDVAWASLFRMHMRLAPSLAGARRFLLGDAGHLSSPFGGEGLNCGIHDGHNLGWKLALTLQGRARPSLLESFAVEREQANRHVLEVSDGLHAAAHAAVGAARSGERPAPMTPEAVAALVRSRAMLDVSYAGSPIVSTFGRDGSGDADAPVPGERDSGALAETTTHTIVVSGGAGDDPGLARLSDRWRGLVEVEQRPTTPEGVTLVRPDGYVGFRSATVDGAALAALDEHLDGYLIAPDAER